WRLSSQPQAPVCLGEVVTETSFSTSARIAGVLTAESNWMLTGIPTPTVSPSLRMPYVAVTAGLRVRKEEVLVEEEPSGPVALTLTVYAVSGARRAVDVHTPEESRPPLTTVPWASVTLT